MVWKKTGNVMGPAGRIDGASAFPRAAGSAPVIVLGGTPQIRTIQIGVPEGKEGPRGLPGVNAIAADDAMAQYVGALDSETRLALNVSFVQREGRYSLNMQSSKRWQDDNSRIRIQSAQWQMGDQYATAGETIHLDLMDVRAKSMIAWRMPVLRSNSTTIRALTGVWGDDDTYPDGGFMKSVVWAGAHWFAQDQDDFENPTEIHGHWSVETPDLYGNLRTRFQVFFKDRTDATKIGGENALISTNRADMHIVVGTTNGTDWGRFMIEGPRAMDRMMYFGASNTWATAIAAGDRFSLGINGVAEGASNAGADFELRRHTNSGTLVGKVMRVARSNGRVAFGDGVWNGEMPTDEAQMSVIWSNAARSGYLASPGTQLTGMRAAFKGIFTADTEKLLLSQMGGNARFAISANGAMEWGPTSGANDTYLSRTAFQQLSTPNTFVAGQGLRIGAPSSGGGQNRTLAFENVPARPVGTVANGGYLFVENGALYYRGSSGNVNMLAAA